MKEIIKCILEDKHYHANKSIDFLNRMDACNWNPTYTNYDEAQLYFYEDKVKPLMNKLKG